jgi:LPXTG-motif cell wall-anchored protein
LLSGAEFDLYQKAETGDSDIVKGGEHGISQLPDGDYVKVNTKSIVTGEKEEGIATVTGLAPGEYYLVETIAPEGYTLPTDAFRIYLTHSAVTVPSDDGEGSQSLLEGSTAEAVLVVQNDKHTAYELPMTGGIGTKWFTVTGFAIILGASAMFVWLTEINKHAHRSRRKRKNT